MRLHRNCQPGKLPERIKNSACRSHPWCRSSASECREEDPNCGQLTDLALLWNNVGLRELIGYLVRGIEQ